MSLREKYGMFLAGKYDGKRRVLIRQFHPRAVFCLLSERLAVFAHTTSEDWMLIEINYLARVTSSVVS
jgi:hypothetical protein